MQRVEHLLGRVIPNDVTVVLLADAQRVLGASATDEGTSATAAPPGLTLTVLDVPSIRAAAAQGRAGYAAALPERDANDTLWCAAALDGEALVAWAWFTGGNVPAPLNSGGSRFAGIGLQLPARCAFVFKVHVAPEQRGAALAASLMAHGIAQAPMSPIDTVITTTAMSNTPFRRSASSIGFERSDWAAEIILGKRHAFRLPKPVTLQDGRQITFRRGAAPNRNP